MRSKLFLMTLVGITLWSHPANAEDKARTITVTGEAEVKIEPDRIFLTIEAESSNRELVKAKEQTDEIVRGALAMLKKNGVDPKDVQTGRVSISPRYEYVDNRQKFAGYTATNGLNIMLKDLSRFDALYGDLLESGVNNVSSIRFSSSKQKEYEEQARLEAIKDAKQKAESMAAVLGERVGRPQSIQAQLAPEYPTPMRYAMAADMKGGAQPTIAPGEISIRASVAVAFELEDKLVP